MAKTRPTDADVGTFLAEIEDPGRRADAQDVCRLMEQETGQSPVMWGESIVGFGARPLVYADGHTEDWPAVGFAPRKANLVLYLMDGFEAHADALARLGPHKTGRACLYVTRLALVDETVLRELVRDSYAAQAGSA